MLTEVKRRPLRAIEGHESALLRIADLAPGVVSILRRHLVTLSTEALLRGWGEAEWFFSNDAGHPFDEQPSALLTRPLNDVPGARAPSPGSAIKIARYPALSQGDAGIFGAPCRPLQTAAGGAVAVSVSYALLAMGTRSRRQSPVY
jgi:hypothetical protein